MAEVYGWRSSSSVLCGLKQGPRPPCMTQFPLGYCWCTDFQSLTVVPSNSSWDLFCQTYYKVPCSPLRESPLISSLARPSESYRSRFYNEEAGDSGKLELTAQASLGLCCAPKVAVLPLPSGSLMNPKHGSGFEHVPLSFHSFLKVERTGFSLFSSVWTPLTHVQFSGLFHKAWSFIR